MVRYLAHWQVVILLIQKNEVIQDFYNVFRFLEKKANSRNSAFNILYHFSNGNAE